MKDKVHWDIHVSGRVQGVFFRASTQEKAQALGVTGTVRNMPSGKEVHIRAEGSEQEVQALIDWCHEGPPQAQVEEVTVKPAPVEGYTDFQVVR